MSAMSPDFANISLTDKVAYLRRPDSYPARTGAVETKETHMSWVFLTDAQAYKLKKPIKRELFDWITADLRRKDCEREVNLNRRLAPDVYFGVVPLTIDEAGRLQLEGEGTAVDWLVKMRRLPNSLMLDWQIEHNCVNRALIRRTVAALCKFYGQSLRFDISPQQYRDDLVADLMQSYRELFAPKYRQSADLVRDTHDTLLNYIEQEADLLDERVQAGRVIDAHGDLRPEHICLEPEPVIIDCLQFSQRLRILDTASELSFLVLECERLGAENLSETIWSAYRKMCRDDAPDHLLAFYKAYHACLRAMVSVWHLKDADVAAPQKWICRSHDYLQIAHSLGMQLLHE